MRGLRAVLVVAAVATLAASSLLPTGAGAQQATKTWVVDAVDDGGSSQFVSADNGTSEITVEVGDTIRWEFDKAMMGHNVVNNSPNWSINQYRDPGGAAFEHTFTKTGEYKYTCTLHNGMSGIVNVVPDVPEGPPTVTAEADPATGTAPLSVNFSANGQDPQGDPLTYSWDLGVPGTDADRASGTNVAYRYDQPGVYDATVTARDPGGNTGTDAVQVTVNGTSPPAATEVEALADPAAGEAPLSVAFSTRLTTRGAVEPFAGGPAEYAGIEGTTDLARSRDETVVSVHLTGLEPDAKYEARVHTQPCSADGEGPLFRFDEGQPEGTPGNEIAMSFTADATGMGMDVVDLEKRAGDGAVSVVVRDVADGQRAACATLAPDPTDLTFSWDFDNDGSEDAAEADPTHTYAAAGDYTAKVTVSNARGGQPVSDTVDVAVSSANQPPDTEISAGPVGTTKHRSASFWFLSTKPGEGAEFECSLDGADFSSCAAPQGYEGLSSRTHTFKVRAVDADGAEDESPADRTWTVDATKPVARGLSPRAGSATRDRTPTIQASVRDTQTDLSKGDLRLYLDGRGVGSFSYDRGRDVLRYVPRRPLSYGSHAVKVTATDSVGNTAAAKWAFKVARGR